MAFLAIAIYCHVRAVCVLSGRHTTNCMLRAMRSSVPFANASLSNTSVWMSPQATFYSCLHKQRCKQSAKLWFHVLGQWPHVLKFPREGAFFIAPRVQDSETTTPEKVMARSLHREEKCYAVAQSRLKQSQPSTCHEKGTGSTESEAGLKLESRLQMARKFGELESIRVDGPASV